MDNVADFLKKYKKHNRFESRGKESTKRQIEDYTERLLRDGYCFITHHDSATGEVVSFYG